jgi:hypothetical protein
LKAAVVLSALMKEYTIPCHDRGHPNVMMVLQSCTDPLHILPGSPNEMFPISFDVTYDINNAAIEQDVVVIEEGLIAVNEEVGMGIKQEDIPEDKNFPGMMAEPDEVSYVCVCLLLDAFCQCPEISVVFMLPIFLAHWNSYMVGNENILRENIFFSACRKKKETLFSGCFLKTRQI